MMAVCQSIPVPDIRPAMPIHPSFSLDSLSSGATSTLWFRNAALATALEGAPKALFAGSFNPLHDGHIEIARVAREILRTEICFEISIRNVDKPDLTAEELAARLVRFPSNAQVVVTRAMKFVEKCQLFPGATFVVGADTIRRIADPKYSAGDKRLLLDTIDEISGSGCRFLVFGRLFDSAFHELERVEMPESLLAICQGVDESRFRRDISSSEIREKLSD